MSIDKRTEFRITRGLADLFIDILGDSGIFILNRELYQSGIEHISACGDLEKMQLAKQLVQNVFSEICSPAKWQILYSKLMKILEVSEKGKEQREDLMRFEFETY